MMNRYRAIISMLALVGAGLLIIAGCAAPAGVKKAGRPNPQQVEIIKPGKFGNHAAADGRRRYLDMWNEQVIREDIAVSTVFMGDSITEFWELPVYFESRDGIILNRGVGGDIASNMVKRFQADVIQLHPRNVVILAGTNDVFFLLGQKVPDQEIVRQVCESIEAMMSAARAAGINVLLCSITPTNEDRADHEGKSRVIPLINKRLKAACAKQGCIYVDYATAMSDENVISGRVMRVGRETVSSPGYVLKTSGWFPKSSPPPSRLYRS